MGEDFRSAEEPPLRFCMNETGHSAPKPPGISFNDSPSNVEKSQ